MKKHLGPSSSTNSEIKIVRTTALYDALQDDKIRLFRMVAGDRKSKEVHLEIQQFSFNPTIQYLAISYAWGRPSSEFPGSWDSPTDLKTVHINSHELKVRQNLFSFLLEARQLSIPGSEYVEMQSGVEWLWVDAICIDQTNIQERNTQVLKMKDIYENAMKVICWLGPSTASSDKAMRFIHDLARIHHSKGMYYYDFKKPIIPEAFEFMNRSQDSLNQLGLLFQRRWWSRAWIVQEVTAGDLYNPPNLYCGQHHCDWEELLLANMCLEQASREKHLSTPWSALINRLQTVRNRRTRNHKNQTIMLLCGVARSFQSSDLRDKVYSLLSIALDGRHEDLEPNYDLPVEQVYTNLATHLIKRDLNLEILRFCGESKKLLLPTWVPDWSVPAPQPLDAYSRESTGMVNIYDASKGRVAAPEFLEDGQALVAYGTIFDQVVETIGVSGVGFHAKLDDSRKWYRFAVGSTPRAQYIGGGSMIEALSRLICADIDSSLSGFGATVVRIGKHHEPQLRLDENDETLLTESFFHSSMWIISTTRSRLLFRTAKGYLGVARYVQTGDMVCILFGCSVPILLRADDALTVAGEAYVQGIMDGEAVPESDDNVMPFHIQ
jgi:hypothetical protein